METIKKKINALKEDNEIKQDEIERLQESLLIPNPPMPADCRPSGRAPADGWNERVQGSIEKRRRGKRKMRAGIGKHGQQNQAARRVS